MLDYIRYGISKNRRHPAFDFFLACVCTVVCILIVIAAHEDRSSEPHVSVSGALINYEARIDQRNPGKYSSLRLRLEGQAIEFRIDPALFKEVVGGSIPEGFVAGDPVTVLVSEEEYLNPVKPFYDDAQVAWVHGLRVGDKRIFDLKDTYAWEQRNRSWSYIPLAIALGMSIYMWLMWSRSGR